MEAEMKMVFQQKVQEKEAKLKQSEEELYARHREMRDALEKQRGDLEEKKRRLESGRPVTPEKGSVSHSVFPFTSQDIDCLSNRLKGGRASSARKMTVGNSSCTSPFSQPGPLMLTLPVHLLREAVVFIVYHWLYYLFSVLS
jgi:hypothetical protein